jgi:thioredoxin 1
MRQFKRKINMYTDTGNVLIDFWSPQCGPCRQLTPIIDEIATEHETLTVVKINILDNMDEARKFDVMALPTLVFLKDGEVVETLVGLKKKEEIVSIIEAMQ